MGEHAMRTLVIYCVTQFPVGILVAVLLDRYINQPGEASWGWLIKIGLAVGWALLSAATWTALDWFYGRGIFSG